MWEQLTIGRVASAPLPPKLREKQRLILGYLKEHPCSNAYEIQIGLGWPDTPHEALLTMQRLKRMVDRGLLTCGLKWPEEYRAKTVHKVLHYWRNDE